MATGPPNKKPGRLKKSYRALQEILPFIKTLIDIILTILKLKG